DTDAVLLGDPAFAWIERFAVGGRDLGPQALWTMGAILVAVLAFVGLFYKELKLATFDAALAAALGFAPKAPLYALMRLVPLTAVVVLDVIGSILVVALVWAPGAAASLLTDPLPWLLGLSVLPGVLAAVSGYCLSHVLDASIAGAMATMAGVLLAAAFLFAPE